MQVQNHFPISIQGFNDVLNLKIHHNKTTKILSRTTATQYMKHKTGNNPFIIPSMLNQQPMLSYANMHPYFS